MRLLTTYAALALATAVPASEVVPARSAAGKGLALDQVIVELGRKHPLHEDIRARNEGSEPIYVSVEPFLVRNPGAVDQQKVSISDPRELGLIVTPRRFVLAPGAYRVIRIAALNPAQEQDRIYRVTIKPETGAVVSDRSVLNVVVGYDVLAIVRPAEARAQIEGRRDGARLTLSNLGRSNALVFRGRRCNARGEACGDIPARRLYAGQSFELTLEQADDSVEYHVDDGDKVRIERY